MPDKTPWPAPAKLNRFLHIVGRRDDGFHDLQTLFQFLDYGDELQFDVRDRGTVRRSGGLPGLAEDEDLAVRAAILLRAQPPGSVILIDGAPAAVSGPDAWAAVVVPAGVRTVCVAPAIEDSCDDEVEVDAGMGEAFDLTGPVPG